MGTPSLMSVVKKKWEAEMIMSLRKSYGIAPLSLAAALLTSVSAAEASPLAKPSVVIEDRGQQQPFPGAELQRVELEAQEPQKPFSDEETLGFSIGNTNVTFGGFLKLDVIASKFSEGEVASNATGRDFFVPNTIPVDGEQVSENSDSQVLDFSARETRFRFNTETPVEGHTIKGTLEFDFMTTSDGNERVANSFTPRIRHAFIEVDNVKGGRITAGQTWSTFFDVRSMPENLDLIGSTGSTNFILQPIIRYTRGPLEVAIEQPETTVTPNGGGALMTPGDDRFPDLTSRYTVKGKWGHVAAAGLVRELRVDGGLPGGGEKATAIAYAGTVSGRIKVGSRDDIRFSGTVGDGVGRYVGINTTTGAVIDNNDDLEKIQTYAGYVAYRHFWSDKWRSNVNAAILSVDNPTTLTGTGATSDVKSIHGNLLYAPNKHLLIGGELMYAKREEESGADGSLLRGQFSIKYGF